ncbi:MAG TPA: hypothetical protein PL110_11095 [Candidatus Eremiobacteraeota bacterium]|nr:MAG: hypothetical protein BWY64_02670 [bacterium ADurb.Bin363]HPZ08651.1 hypothetical protein [Candidatus Eremiobacteraeota bacterium]
MSAIKEKILNVKLPVELHKELKIQSAVREQSIKDMVQQAIREFLQKIKGEEEDKDFNNFMKAWENAEEEEPEPGDIEAIERGRREIANGEVEDFEEVFKEFENES